MTPQERQRVTDLFNRLARLESAPREGEAEQLIAEGLRQAPNATYAMVQTILVQEEALLRANERIRELEGGEDAEPAGQGGFLDTVRGAFGGNAGTPRRVSVPSTRRPGGPMGVPPGLERSLQERNAAPDARIGQGGSFLGQAAAIATGVVIGSVAVDALRGQFGSQAGTASAAESGQAASQQQASLDDLRGNAQDDAGDDHADYDDGDSDYADFDGGDFDFG